MSNDNFKLSIGKLIMLILALMIIISGSTFAYLQWSTSESQQTEVVFTFEQYFSCAADGGGNITSNDIELVPTSCTNTEHAIQRKIIVNPTLNTDDTNISMDLWLDINDIGTGFSGSENFRYTLTTTENDCTKGIINYGTFNGKSTNDQILLLDEKIYSESMTDTYYLYIWLDSDETSKTTMNQTLDLSLNGNCTNVSKGELFYAVYSADDTSLRFYKEDEGVITEGTTYNNLTVTNVYKTYENDVYTYDSGTTLTTSPWDSIRENVTKIVIEDEILPYSTANWFAYFVNTTSVDVTKLNTSKTVDMHGMFDRTGYNAISFSIIGLNNWDVSKVTNMQQIFHAVGRNATTWNIGDLSNWDVSSVTDMYGMFDLACYNGSTFDIGDIGNWDMSNVNSTKQMFWKAGLSATTWNIGDLSNWDVSSVTDMYGMFGLACYNGSTFDIGDIGNWDVSNVTDMQQMFQEVGKNATTWNIGDLSNWNTSNVTTMHLMFWETGKYVTIFNIGNIGNWDTSNVTTMLEMFENAGLNAMNWSLDLSGWNVDKVISYAEFNTGVTDKITPPIWVNEERGTTE